MPLGIGMNKSFLLPIPKKSFSFGLGYKPTEQELESRDTNNKARRDNNKKGIITLLPS